MNPIYAVFIFTLLVSPALAQDFNFNQSLQNTFLVNPASAGQASAHSLRLTLLARTQWDNPGSPKGYQGGATTMEWRHCLSSSRHFFALGLAVQHDWSVLGGMSNTQALPVAAYHLHLGDDWFIAAGAATGILSYSILEDNLKFDAQYQSGYFNGDRDNKENLTGNGRVVADLGAGFECYNNRKGISLGVSWQHLNTPTYSFIDNENSLGISFIAHGTYSVPFNHKGSKAVSGKFLLRRQSLTGNNSKQWMALTGVAGRFPIADLEDNILQFGIYVRLGGIPNYHLAVNAVVPTFTYMNNDWSASLSYDINSSGIRTRFAGGMELTTTFSFGKNDKCVNCPRF